MTCIVGIANGKNVWMGGDRCGSSETEKFEIVYPKIWIGDIPTGRFFNNSTEKIIVGDRGSFRCAPLMRYGLKLPKLKTNQKAIEWLAIDFADALREIFKKKGFTEIKDNSEIMPEDSAFLIGLRGHIYCMEPNFQILDIKVNEYAIGSGGPFALGSLHTSKNLGWTPQKRIESGLQAAADINPYVAPPFDIMNI